MPSSIFSMPHVRFASHRRPSPASSASSSPKQRDVANMMPNGVPSTTPAVPRASTGPTYTLAAKRNVCLDASALNVQQSAPLGLGLSLPEGGPVHHPLSRMPLSDHGSQTSDRTVRVDLHADSDLDEESDDNSVGDRDDSPRLRCLGVISERQKVFKRIGTPHPSKLADNYFCDDAADDDEEDDDDDHSDSEGCAFLDDDDDDDEETDHLEQAFTRLAH